MLNRITYVKKEEDTITIDPSALEEEQDEVSTTDAPKEQVEQIEQVIGENANNQLQILGSENVYNVLLIGSDRRSSTERGRSDSMILVSINEDTKKIVATSFLRDIYLAIPQVEQGNRINAAYALGGAPLLLETIKNNFGIQIDNYVILDFESFVEVIDTIGGVTLELDDTETAVAVKAGGTQQGNSVKMNGEQALSYARNRSDGNVDFSRTERQRIILQAILNKSKSLTMLELNDVLNQVLPMITTNISKSDILSLTWNFKDYIRYDIESWSIPVAGSYQPVQIRKMEVLAIDFSKNIEELKNRIYGE